MLVSVIEFCNFNSKVTTGVSVSGFGSIELTFAFASVSASAFASVSASAFASASASASAFASASASAIGRYDNFILSSCSLESYRLISIKFLILYISIVRLLPLPNVFKKPWTTL